MMNDTSLILLVIIAMLIVSNTYERFKAGKREQQLFNRLMARTFREYVEGEVHLNEMNENPSPEDIIAGLKTEDEDGYGPGGFAVG